MVVLGLRGKLIGSKELVIAVLSNVARFETAAVEDRGKLDAIKVLKVGASEGALGTVAVVIIAVVVAVTVVAVVRTLAIGGPSGTHRNDFAENVRQLSGTG